MSEKTIIITGGAGGFGKLTATKIAAKGYRIIIADVNEEAMAATKDEVIKKTGNENIVTKKLDLSSLASVRKFSEDIKNDGEKISGLLCNAGITSVKGRSKEDNMDLVFEINYLGHFLLSLLLLPSLEENGRIMLVSSDMHVPLVGSIDWIPTDQVAYPEGDLASSELRYSYSKLCLLFFNYELSRKLKEAGSKRVINAFNPGLMYTTGLMKDKSVFTDEFLEKVKSMDRLGDIDKNSDIMAELMTDEEYGKESGKYFDRGTKAIKSSELSYNEEDQDQLWKDSLKLTGLTEEEVSKNLK